MFYHGQDADSAFGDEREHEDIQEHGLYMSWGGDGDEIVEVLNRHGLTTLWDGSDRTRIKAFHSPLPSSRRSR